MDRFLNRTESLRSLFRNDTQNYVILKIAVISPHNQTKEAHAHIQCYHQYR